MNVILYWCELEANSVEIKGIGLKSFSWVLNDSHSRKATNKRKLSTVVLQQRGGGDPLASSHSPASSPSLLNQSTFGTNCSGAPALLSSYRPRFSSAGDEEAAKIVCLRGRWVKTKGGREGGSRRWTGPEESGAEPQFQADVTSVTDWLMEAVTCRQLPGTSVCYIC